VFFFNQKTDDIIEMRLIAGNRKQITDRVFVSPGNRSYVILSLYRIEPMCDAVRYIIVLLPTYV